MTGVQTVKVSVSDAATRLDRWLATRFPDLSYGLVQKLLRTGQIRVDGARARGNLRLTAGQRVRIPPMVSPSPRSSNFNSKIEQQDVQLLRSRILFENHELIAIDKPTGLPVQGGTGQRRHVDLLSRALVKESDLPPKLVHRLDKDTSGVLLLAKTAETARWIGNAFKTGAIRKTYWAIVVGVPFPELGTIENELSKRVGARGERVTAVSDLGKSARTRYQVLDRSGSLAALLALYPETGRTHQLRVHCVELGTPILGDGKYGGRRSFLSKLPAEQRLHLHARSIELPEKDGEALRFIAPLPEHMLVSMKQLSLDTGV